MSEDIRKRSEEQLKLLEEVTAVQLAEPVTALVPLAEADKPVALEIKKRMSEIDMGNTGSIIAFGSAAQSELQVISQAMLADVRNKDVGPAGDSLQASAMPLTTPAWALLRWRRCLSLRFQP